MSDDTNALPRRVFEIGWEQKPGIDECAHVWKSVAYRRPDDQVGFVEQCQKCGVPRCPSHACIERRHHRDMHIFEDGSFEPVGGYLAPESPDHLTEEENRG